MPHSSAILARNFERDLIQKVGDPLMYAPSMKLSVIKKGQVCFRWECGENHKFYDLASLTKIIFSAPTWMRIYQDSSLSVEDEVAAYLPWWKGAGKVKVKDLLTHQAGLNWWKPYYKLLGKRSSHEVSWKKLKSLLAKEKSNPSTKHAVYSDLDLFYLGFIAEELFQKSLLEIWEDLAGRMHFKDFHFQNSKKSHFKRSLYASTGFSEFRSRELLAEVHDDNTFSLGGVAPHAGLFGTLKDVEDYLIKMRLILMNDEAFGFKSQTLVDFSKRRTPVASGDFGYIFMKPTKGSASCGRFFDDSSFGHTGFTGTSIWHSPKKDVGVIFLSNRVNYGVDVELFKNLRPLVHDLVMKLI